MEIELTDAQRTFVADDSDKRLLLGGRQVGKTTALAVDALDNATDGNQVALTAPRHEMAVTAFERVRQLAYQRPWVGRTLGDTLTRLSFVGGGSITAVTVSSLVDPQRGHTPQINEFDHVAVDEGDRIDSDQFDALSRLDSNDGPESVTVVGTPRTESPNLKPLTTPPSTESNDDWFTVYQRTGDLEDAWRSVENAREEFSAVQTATELDGLFVTDPAEYADAVY